MTAKDIKEFPGICPICEVEVVFRAENSWFRDALKCQGCGSIPRERALMRVIKMLYPNWRNMAIHESSPVFRGVSKKLRDECSGYVFSQLDESISQGTHHPTMGHRSEDLESQKFDSEIFDIVVTQDVFEHIFDPIAATNEIMRTLRPGGAHIFSVPIIRKAQRSRRRASKANGMITYALEPQYHGNPMSAKGALVTIDWGYDILPMLSSTGHSHSMFYFDDIEQGIRAEYIEILVGHRAPLTFDLGNPTV